MGTTVKLPIGIENFEKIRKEGFYYVDKTGMITELLNGWGEVNLFTRPRRFGASEVTIKHVHELLQLMAVVTQDNRFEEVYSPDMEGRTMTMCEVLDRVESRGIRKGVRKGIVQGENKILSLMNYLLSNNRTEDAKRATEDKAYRNKLIAEIFENKL